MQRTMRTPSATFWKTKHLKYGTKRIIINIMDKEIEKAIYSLLDTLKGEGLTDYTIRVQRKWNLDSDTARKVINKWAVDNLI